jgi:uridine phosphorylase
MPKKLPHTGLLPDSLPEAVLTCGDPDRAAFIAGFLDQTEAVAKRREYHTYRGYHRQVPLAVCSHGIGAPGAAIAFEELIMAGARCLLRIGTCGSLQPHIQPGHLVIATAAVQHTGYGREAVPFGYPAVPDLTLTYHLQRLARDNGRRYHSGIVLTRDAFFAGVATPDAPVYAQQSAAHVLAVEMECAALFLVGNLRQVRTGGILAVNGHVLADTEGIETFSGYEQATADALTAGTKLALATLTDPAFLEEIHVAG